MSLLKTFKDKLGNIIYPTTHAKAVLVEKDGTVVNLQTAINNGDIGGGGAPKLDINPTSVTIKNYPNGTLWLTSSNNEINLFAKVNGIKYTLQLEKSLDEIALKFSSDSDFTLSAPKNWDGTLEYTLDNGSTWTTWDGSQLSGTASQPIYLRGIGNSVINGTDSYYWNFTGKYCTGNIENLLDYQTVANGEHPVMGERCYENLFRYCTNLIQAPELPATTLANECYSMMFKGCTSLTKTPELPATELADSCYYTMFTGCTSLTKAPELPATTLRVSCYRNMFSGCTSLKLSETQTGEYQYAYRIPTTGEGTTATNALTNMFANTGGTFTGTPEINTTYYTTNQPV